MARPAPPWIRLLAAICALCGAATVLAPPTAMATARATASPPPQLRVGGNKLLSGNTPIQLRGVDYTYLDQYCEWPDVDPEGSLANTIRNMRAWGVDVVRLAINPYCWLGLVDPGYPSAGMQPSNGYASPADYQAAYVQAVTQFVGAGIYVDINAGGTDNMPDPSWVQLWQQVATRFAANHQVMFDPVNEFALWPGDTGQTGGVDPWACWRDGCVVRATQGQTTGVAAGSSYRAPGVQDLVDVIRGIGTSLRPTNGIWPNQSGYSRSEAWSQQPNPTTGASTQPITLGALDYDDQVGGWVSHLPTDPARSLVLDTHRYDITSDGAGTASMGAGDSSFDSFLATSLVPIAKAHPVIFGEVGEFACDNAASMNKTNPNPDYTVNALRQVDLANKTDGVLIGALSWEWRPPGSGYGCPAPNSADRPGGPLLLAAASTTGVTPTASQGVAVRTWLRSYVPVLSQLTVSPASLVDGGYASTDHSVPIKVSWVDSIAATTTISVQQASTVPCGSRTCVTWHTVAISRTHQDVRGANLLQIGGYIGGSELARGNYRLVFVARANAVASTPAFAGFRIVS